VATFSGGGCRRVFAADGRRRGGHFHDENQGASWPICLHGLSRA
jgi:hypothetical protein